VDRLPARVIGVHSVEVLARPQAVDVDAVEVLVPLAARGSGLLYLALLLVLLDHREVVIVGRVILGFLVAQTVSRLPNFVENEPRVHERL
jgi:hypothetical protein